MAPAARNQAGAQNQAFAAMAASVDATGATIIESALTMAQFASFALGSKGVILAAGAAVLSTIFQTCMQPKPPVDLSAVVHDAVQAVAVSLQIESADATIGVDYDWLHDHYKAYWADDAPVSDTDYQQFRSELEGKLDADTGIVQTVALLKEPDYQDKGFVLFSLGASLVLLMYKIAVIIEEKDGERAARLIHAEFGLGRLLPANAATQPLV